MGIVELIKQRTKREEFENGIEEEGIKQVRKIKKDSVNFEIIKVFLDHTNYSMEEIAFMVDVPVSFVQMVKIKELFFNEGLFFVETVHITTVKQNLTQQ